MTVKQTTVLFEITGDKQTCMLIQRMKAFKAKDFTKELTGQTHSVL